MILSLLYKMTWKVLSAASVLLRGEAADRFWFAALSRLVPRSRWREVFPVTPGTVLGWHRRFIAWNWDYRATTNRTPTHPCGDQGACASARSREPAVGHRRIQGELARLGHRITASTAWEISNAAGIDPAPRRSGPTWREFLTAQAEGIIAADFFHIDTAPGKRLGLLHE